MCGSFADHGIDYAKTNYNIEHDYKVILITTSLRGDTINKQDYFEGQKLFLKSIENGKK